MITINFYPDEGPGRAATSEPIPAIRQPLKERLIAAMGEAHRTTGQPTKWRISPEGWDAIRSAHRPGVKVLNIGRSVLQSSPITGVLGLPYAIDCSLSRGVIAVLECER